jgi:hypothetical protein
MELSWEDAKEAFREVLEEEFGGGPVRIAPKWGGGKMILTPFDSSLQPKEVPLNAFFKKITAVREKLRVIEQKINNNPALKPEDKMEMQQLITRAYGSLTTFNVLFREEEDRFVGAKDVNE